ncbi:TPA: methionine adenosyltransferase domain-containing protein [Candidatus Micrarchaeota archaeon]|nr:methionine adenosyltransferase domain-containing protein [Candidatus Micrarchaeota archaeon]HIH30634.1 methionine adenosyltransferase domain-containing protein [Candidatus Micrarchaeota archaeon]
MPAEFKRRGHPDRLADSVASAAGSTLLKLDPNARFDIQVTVHFGPVHMRNGRGDVPISLKESPIVFICGQLGTSADRALYEQKVETSVREAFLSVGYNSGNTFDPNDIHVIKSFNNQSPNIAAGIDRKGAAHGAGDATISIAYASSQTSNHLNASHALALAVNQRLDAAFEYGSINGLQPDGKAQVEVGFCGRENHFPVGPKMASDVIVAAQHSQGADRNSFIKSIKDLVRSVNEVIVTPAGKRLNLIKNSTDIIIDGAGDFIIGGPVADTGVSGRMDSLYVSGATRTYGGGLLVGRDVTKTDVSCLLSARCIAIHLVNGLAKDAQVKITYAIGAPAPESVIITARGCKYSEQQLSSAICRTFDLSPDGMKKNLGLKAKDFASIARNGFIGVEANGSHRWETVDEEKVGILLRHLKRGLSIGVPSGPPRKLKVTR